MSHFFDVLSAALLLVSSSFSHSLNTGIDVRDKQMRENAVAMTASIADKVQLTVTSKRQIVKK